MLSHRKGDLSAVAKAETLSPEISIIARDQAIHAAEIQDEMRDKHGECIYGVPGSKVAAGKLTVNVGTWEVHPTLLQKSTVQESKRRRNGMVKGWKSDQLIVICSTKYMKGLTQEHKGKGKTMPNSEVGKTQIKLSLITEHAARNSGFRFTSLYHLLNKEFLRDRFYRLDKNKAVGIDGTTWEDYSKDLEDNLEGLIRRIGCRSYKPLPSKRVYIPKNEHEKRPLGISAIETKIVESGITRILGSIYEIDFLPCSYGFHPGQSCHDALKALNGAIMHHSVNHIVEADIKGFFDNVSHEHLMGFLKIRIGDTAMLGLIEKFLKAGFIDRGKYNETNQGTPQGSILSPLLSNVFLHYTLDTWFENVVRKHVKGYVQLVRYADDYVIAVQYQDDAKRIEKAIYNRFSKYGLEIHPTKSRCISFGRFEMDNAKNQRRKANTFDFLGFTHYCGKSRNGKYKLVYKTQRKKFAKACKNMWTWLKEVRNKEQVEIWWKTLKIKLQGHYNYYGISSNYPGIYRFYFSVLKMIRYWMNHRSQRKTMTQKKFQMYLQRYPLPKPRIKHVFFVCQR